MLCRKIKRQQQKHFWAGGYSFGLSQYRISIAKCAFEIQYANTQIYPQCDHWPDSVYVCARMDFEKGGRKGRE